MNKENNRREKIIADNIKKLRYHRKQYYISGFVALLTLGTLAAYIIVSIHQSSQTRESLSLARQNYIDENRPYVFPGHPTKMINKYDYFAIVPYVNYGKTPAYGVRIAQLFYHGKKIIDPREFKYTSNEFDRIFAPFNQDTEKIRINEGLSDTSWDSRFFFVGKIWYSDYWKRQHYTTFAYEWIYISDGFTRLPKYESADQYEKSQTND